MKREISPELMQWLLAGWAGFEDDPAAVFPDLKNQSPEQYQKQLQHILDTHASAVTAG